MLNQTFGSAAITELCCQLLHLPVADRFSVLSEVLGFFPSATPKQSFQVGPLRALFADCWEEQHSEPVPLQALRNLVTGPCRISVKEQLIALLDANSESELADRLVEMLGFLRQASSPAIRQPELFGDAVNVRPSAVMPPVVPGSVVRDLASLVRPASASAHRAPAHSRDPE